MRCERSHITCPGYRHPLDVLMRHEDVETVARKSNAAVLESERTTTILQPSGSSLVPQLAVDPEEAAIGAYYSSYCVSSSTLCSLDHIRRQGNGCLWATIKMLGMMHLNQIWQLPGGDDALLRQYTSATTLLNSALASISESREDSTLLATFLLSMAEMKTSRDFTLRYWLAHTKGAATLMELRGADQVSSRIGAALFLQISSQIVIYCILGKRHIPDELQVLREKIRPYVIGGSHPLWQWHGLMYRFANCFATACAVQPELDVNDAQAIINEALRINHDMSMVFQQAGASWRYGTQPGNTLSPLVNHQHLYQTLLAIRVWSDRRTAAILLLTIVVRIIGRCRDQHALEKDPQLYIKEAYEAIGEAAIETLAAVPQCLAGLKGKSSGEGTAASNDGIRLCDSGSEYDERVFELTKEDATPLPHMDSCRVHWAVYFAVECEFVEPWVRNRLLEVLENYGRIMQIQQWQILAENVRSSVPKPEQTLQASVEVMS